MLPLFFLTALLLPSVAPTSQRLSTASFPLYRRPLSPEAPSTSHGAWLQRGTIYVDIHMEDAWIDGDNAGDPVVPDGRRYSLALDEGGERREVLAVACSPEREVFKLFYTPTAPGELVHFSHECAKVPNPSGTPLVVIDRGVDVAPAKWKEAPAIKVGDDGNVVAPPPEKSFIEKYWMYLLPLAFILLTGGGSDEEPKK